MRGAEDRHPQTMHALMGDEIRRRALSKVAWRFLPVLIIAYVLNYLDRTSVGFAALTMNRDIGLTAYQFGWGAGLLFASYSIFEIPSNLILYRVGARRWIARIMITWGLVAAANAFIVGPSSFYVVRLLLGAAEAGFFRGSRFSSPPGFPSIIARGCWLGSWSRSRSRRSSADRFPPSCCKWTDCCVWPVGSGCSLSRGCQPALSDLSSS
jgi:sugar phosphate permease